MLVEPTAVGVKLIRLVQDAPAASVPGLEVDVSCGQVEPLPIANPVGMVGFKPVAGTGNVSAVLPIFVTVTVCGLSLLIERTAVEAKVRAGASAKSSFTTAALPLSARYTFPFPSTDTPWG